MRFKSSLVATLFLVLLAAPAGAMNWSLGANLGFAVLSPTASNSKSTTVFAWPNQAPIPGLRVGFTGQNPQHEIFFDTALLLTSQKDIGSTRDFTATANYQYNFGASGSVAPFVTFGGGLVLTGLKDETVNPTFDISASS